MASDPNCYDCQQSSAVGGCAKHQTLNWGTLLSDENQRLREENARLRVELVQSVAAAKSEAKQAREATTSVEVFAAELREENARLKADQSDWRKGVALIASALDAADIPALCCVSLAERALCLRGELETAEGLLRRSVKCLRGEGSTRDLLADLDAALTPGEGR